jgi:hypothetical protein
MFHTRSIRKSVLTPSVPVKLNKQTIFFSFLENFMPNYYFISKLIKTNVFNDESDNLLNKYTIDGQQVHFKNSIELFKSLELDYIYKHKIYCDYLDYCEFGLATEFFKVFLNKIYRSKNIHKKSKDIYAHIHIDELYRLKNKTRKLLIANERKGFTVTNIYKFFKTS